MVAVKTIQDIKNAYKKLKDERKVLNWGEFSELVGYDRTYVSRVLNEHEPLTGEMVGQINLKLNETNNVSRGINRVSEPDETYLQKRQNIKLSNRKEVPVYGGFTSLGNIEILDDENVKHKVVAQLPAEVFPGCDYAEKAKGDSMYPLIMNQALLVGKICPVKGISYGEKYIIKTKDGLDTTKFIHPGTDAGKIKLKAYNKSIPEQEIEMSDIIFVCRVQWIINPT